MSILKLIAAMRRRQAAAQAASDPLTTALRILGPETFAGEQRLIGAVEQAQAEQSRCISTGMEPLTTEQAEALTVLADVEQVWANPLLDVPLQRQAGEVGGIAQYPPFKPGGGGRS